MQLLFKPESFIKYALRKTSKINREGKRSTRENIIPKWQIKCWKDWILRPKKKTSKTTYQYTKLDIDIQPARALKSKMILTLDVPNSGCSLLLNHKYDSIKIIVHLVKAVSNKGIAWTAKSKMLLQKLKGEPKKKKKYKQKR